MLTHKALLVMTFFEATSYRKELMSMLLVVSYKELHYTGQQGSDIY